MSFAEFWQRWPRREKRKDAEKAWGQVRGDRHFGAIIEALEWQIPHHGWDGGRFTPLPASYLRSERWTDERPLTPAEQQAQADFRLWKEMHAADPQVKTVTFDMFQAFRKARREGAA